MVNGTWLGEGESPPSKSGARVDPHLGTPSNCTWVELRGGFRSSLGMVNSSNSHFHKNRSRIVQFRTRFITQQLVSTWWDSISQLLGFHGAVNIRGSTPGPRSRILNDPGRRTGGHGFEKSCFEQGALPLRGRR